MSPWIAASREVLNSSEAVDPTEFRAVVAALAEPRRRWFLSGQGRSGFVAAMVAMRLMHIGRQSHTVGEATAPAIRSGDGLIVISRSGATPTSVRHAEIAATTRALVAAVTGGPDTPLARLADVTMTIPATPTSQLGGNRFEQTALIVLDSVVNAVAARMLDVDAQLRARHANLQ